MFAGLVWLCTNSSSNSKSNSKLSFAKVDHAGASTSNDPRKDASLIFDTMHAVQNYNVINLFLMTNILNSTAAIPVMLGLLRGELAYRLVTPASVLCGCLTGLLSVILYGVVQASHWGVSKADGIHRVFLGRVDI